MTSESCYSMFVLFNAPSASKYTLRFIKSIYYTLTVFICLSMIISNIFTVYLTLIVFLYQSPLFPFLYVCIINAFVNPWYLFFLPYPNYSIYFQQLLCPFLFYIFNNFSCYLVSTRRIPTT